MKLLKHKTQLLYRFFNVATFTSIKLSAFIKSRGRAARCMKIISRRRGRSKPNPEATRQSQQAFRSLYTGRGNCTL